MRGASVYMHISMSVYKYVFYLYIRIYVSINVWVYALIINKCCFPLSSFSLSLFQSNFYQKHDADIIKAAKLKEVEDELRIQV